MYTVYMHVNKTNGKKYIGQTCQEPKNRWGNGSTYKPCVVFYRAIQKYGWNGFEHEIIASGLTSDEANHMEEELIARYDTTNPAFGYNLKKGGDNHLLNEETKKKLSEAAKNRSDEWRQKQRNAHLGREQSEEERAKRRKPVYCVELDKVFESMKQAAIELELNPGNISNCLTGRQNKTGGYHWRYADELLATA